MTDERIKEYLEKVKNANSYNYKFTITLIGREIEKNSSFVYLSDIISENMFNLSVYTYHYDIDGIKFESHAGYSLTNHGFNIKGNE